MIMDLDDLFSRPEDLSSLTPEERIMSAALDCIEELGLEGTTVRAIAARADLNPAAVNYYYRSKDRLIEGALRRAWTHFSEDIERILKEIPDPDEGLRLALRFIIEGSYRNPRIIRAVITEHPVLRIEAATFIREAFRTLAERRGRGRPGDTAPALLVSLVTMMGFANDVFSLITDLDLSSAEARECLAVDLGARLFDLDARGECRRTEA